MRRAAALVLIGSCLLPCAGMAASSNPRPEHPRPDFERERWQNLNGSWQFCFDRDDRGLSEQWPLGTGPFDRSITVPFPWQSELSGIGDDSGQSVGWYRRNVQIPPSWQGHHVWLCFGGVEREARVWVNGRAMGRHEDGYTPFAFDITEQAFTGQEVRIDVRVFDGANTAAQRTASPRIASGVWQTVWLEARPALHVDALQLVPTRVNDQWIVEAEVALSGPDGPATVDIHSPDAAFGSHQLSTTLANGRGTVNALLKVNSGKPWSPEDPHLYHLEVSATGADRQRDLVRSYFGLRTISRGKYGDLGHEVLLLNGEPLFLRGAIDPSWNAAGLSTAPSDEFLQHDLQLARQLGLNLLKIREKIDEPRRLYWADRLGVLLWQEFPRADCSSESSRALWTANMRAILRRDANHPALIGWTLFHDSDGIGGEQFKGDSSMQKWVYEQVGEIRDRLDPSRLVEDNATSRMDHVATDVNSWQFRIDDYWVAREHIGQIVSRTRPGSALGYVPGLTQKGEPLICGEFSAVGSAGGDVSWALRFLLTQLRRHAVIQGHIFGSFYDVPWQRDGLLRFDRTVKEYGYGEFVPNITVADLQGDDFIGFDAPPVIETAPGEELALALFASHYSGHPGPARLRWRVIGTDDLGRPVASGAQSREILWQRGTVTYQTPLRVRIPEGASFVGAVQAELLDSENRRIAANYVNLIADIGAAADLQGAPRPAVPANPSVEVLSPRIVALRIPPRAFAAVKSDPPQTEQKHYSFGNWQVEYHIALPDFVRQAIPSQMVLMAELAAEGHPRDSQPEDASQGPTTATSSLQVLLWNEEVTRVALSNNLADSRGVLSHHARFRDGAYGELMRRRIDLTDRSPLRESIYQQAFFPLVFRTEGPQTRLSIFGRRLGRYMIDPTLIVQTAKQLEQPVGFISYEPVAVDPFLAKQASPAATPPPEPN